MNIPYHGLRLYNYVARRSYQLMFRSGVKLRVTPGARVHGEVYSFSCERDVPEQVASILSFLRNVGVPDRFVVVSDGSHTAQGTDVLNRLHPCVEVIPWRRLVRHDLPATVKKYADEYPLGKKLAMLMSLLVTKPTIYTDSDILFFRKGSLIAEMLSAPGNTQWYLLDYQHSLDMRMGAFVQNTPPVNSGFLLLRHPLQTDTAIECLEQVRDQFHYWSEQTTVHIALTSAGAMALPSDTFILTEDDRWSGTDQYATKDIALRHYVSPVRHLFWLGWRYAMARPALQQGVGSRTY